MNLINIARAKLLGGLLAEYRTMRNMSVEELARKSGLKESRIERIESGDQILGVDTVKKLASALELPESAFFITGMENAEELMRVLFEIESKFGLYPDCDKSGVSLRFKGTDSYRLCIEPLLKEWIDAREESTNYARWKAEFTANERAIVNELREKNRQLAADNNYLLNRVRDLEMQLAETVKERNSALIGKSRAEIKDSLGIFEKAKEDEIPKFGVGVSKDTSEGEWCDNELLRILVPDFDEQNEQANEGAVSRKNTLFGIRKNGGGGRNAGGTFRTSIVGRSIVERAQQYILCKDGTVEDRFETVLGWDISENELRKACENVYKINPDIIFELKNSSHPNAYRFQKFLPWSELEEAPTPVELEDEKESQVTVEVSAEKPKRGRKKKVAKSDEGISF